MMVLDGLLDFGDHRYLAGKTKGQFAGTEARRGRTLSELC